MGVMAGRYSDLGGNRRVRFFGRRAWTYGPEAGVSSIVNGTVHIRSGLSCMAYNPGDTILFQWSPDTNLVVNGDFTVNTGWVFESRVTYDATNKEVDFSGASALYGVQRTDLYISPLPGEIYFTRFTIKNYVSGAAATRISNNYGTNRSANGTYTDVITITSGENRVAIMARASGTSLSVDDFSVYRIMPDRYISAVSGLTAIVDKVDVAGVSFTLKNFFGNFPASTTCVKVW